MHLTLVVASQCPASVCDTEAGPVRQWMCGIPTGQQALYSLCMCVYAHVFVCVYVCEYVCFSVVEELVVDPTEALEHGCSVENAWRRRQESLLLYSCQGQGQVCFWATPEDTSPPSALPCCLRNLTGLNCWLCLLPSKEL